MAVMPPSVLLQNIVIHPCCQDIDFRTGSDDKQCFLSYSGPGRRLKQTAEGKVAWLITKS